MTTPRYNLLCENAPELPESLPKILNLATQNVPKIKKPVILNSQFLALKCVTPPSIVPDDSHKTKVDPFGSTFCFMVYVRTFSVVALSARFVLRHSEGILSYLR